MHGSSFRSRDQGYPGRRSSRRRLWLGVAISAAAHLALLPALLSAISRAPQLPADNPVVIDLTPFPPPPRPQSPAPPSPDPDPGGSPPSSPQASPEAQPAAAAPPAPPTPRPPASPVRARPPVPAPPTVPTATATAALAPGPAAQPASVGAADLIGAAVAGAGAGSGSGQGGGTGSGSGTGVGSGSGSGGDCDMIARLQRALRDDPDIRAGLVRARRDLPPGRTPLLWNGAWIRTPGEDGDGLAGVRQAIAVEVAFAPPACRSQPMRGLVLLTLADGPSPPAVALGTGAWRWQDLTGASRR